MKSLSWGFCRVNFKFLLIVTYLLLLIYLLLFDIRVGKNILKLQETLGAWRFHFQPSTQRSQICYNTKPFGYFWLNIYDVKFFHSRECHTVNIAVGDLSDTCLLLFLNEKHATENKHLLRIYAVVDQVTRTPKRYDSYFLYLG